MLQSSVSCYMLVLCFMSLFYVIITNTMAYWYDGAALAATRSPVIALFWCLIKFTTTTIQKHYDTQQCENMNVNSNMSTLTMHLRSIITGLVCSCEHTVPVCPYEHTGPVCYCKHTGAVRPCELIGPV